MLCHYVSDQAEKMFRSVESMHLGWQMTLIVLRLDCAVWWWRLMIANLNLEIHKISRLVGTYGDTVNPAIGVHKHRKQFSKTRHKSIHNKQMPFVHFAQKFDFR